VSTEPNYERIYLQPFAGDDGGHTWCSDRIEDEDIEYVRKDVHARAITAAVASEREACAAYHDGERQEMTKLSTSYHQGGRPEQADKCLARAGTHIASAAAIRARSAP